MDITETEALCWYVVFMIYEIKSAQKSCFSAMPYIQNLHYNRRQDDVKPNTKQMGKQTK